MCTGGEGGGEVCSARTGGEGGRRRRRGARRWASAGKEKEKGGEGVRTDREGKGVKS